MNYTKKIVAISVFCIANQAFGMLNEGLRIAICKEFKIKNGESRREAFIPILIEYEEKTKANLKEYILTTMGIAVVGGVCAYGIYKCAPHSQLWQFPALASFIGLWISCSYGCEVMSKTANIKTLQKANKEPVDWYNVQQIGQHSLYANTDRNRIGRSIFSIHNSYKLVNVEGKSVKWNMKDPECVKEIVSGKYNFPNWTFEVSQAEE